MHFSFYPFASHGIYPIVADPSCNFETDNCNWYNGESNSISWRRNRGYTVTAYTGPGEDHTLGNETGHYVFSDMSALGFSLVEGQQGLFYSPFINYTDSSGMITFWYHMLGKGVGCLDIEVHCYNNTVCPPWAMKRVWRKCGSEGIEWIQGSARADVCGSRNLFQVSYI